MATETQARRAMIIQMLEGWPSAAASMTSATVDAYCSAVADMPFEAVQRSVNQFASGRVERNNAFPPAAAEFAMNAREWQVALEKRGSLAGPELHNGLIEMDFDQGRIDMRGLTTAEQDLIIQNKGMAPSGRSLAYLPLEEIREALQQGDLAAVEGGKTFAAPRLGRMP